MNTKTMLAASIVILIASPGISAPIDPADLFSAPDETMMSCTGVMGDPDEFRISWSPILEIKKNGPVKKYASEITCKVLKIDPEGEEDPVEYGEVEASPEALPATECPLEGDICSTSLPMEDIFAAAAEAVENGDIVLDEGTELSDYDLACFAKVKGLNPPGKSQNHPQGVVPCDVVQSSNCPAWSAEELADVGSHGGTTLSDIENLTTAVYTGLYSDEEFGNLGEGLSINVVAFTGFHNGWQEYVAHYSHNSQSIFPDSETPDPENDVTRMMTVSEEEYNACKQELIDHVTNPTP